MGEALVLGQYILRVLKPTQTRWSGEGIHGENTAQMGAVPLQSLWHSSSCAPPGDAPCSPYTYGLTPWAAFLRRSAAKHFCKLGVLPRVTVVTRRHEGRIDQGSGRA
jgi:hypothetical protein